MTTAKGYAKTNHCNENITVSAHKGKTSNKKFDEDLDD
jgi:hypothetical protein